MKCAEFSALALVVIAVLALITPMQVVHASAYGTVELGVINLNTGELEASTEKVSWTTPATIHLTASFETTEEDWTADIRLIKEILVGIAIGYGSLYCIWGSVVLGVLALHFNSTTDYTYFIDRTGTWEFTIDATIVESGSVGGIVVPVDKFSLLAPYIGLASTSLVATVVTAIYIKRVKHRKVHEI